MVSDDFIPDECEQFYMNWQECQVALPSWPYQLCGPPLYPQASRVQQRLVEPLGWVRPLNTRSVAAW
jgi:hypothetical protein